MVTNPIWKSLNFDYYHSKLFRANFSSMFNILLDFNFLSIYHPLLGCYIFTFGNFNNDATWFASSTTVNPSSL